MPAAAAIPRLDTAVATSGARRRFTLPNAAGASPLRPRENSMRLQRYRFAFMLDSAALMITKFIIAAAPSNPKSANTFTNGLPVTTFAPDSVHGWTASTTASARK